MTESRLRAARVGEIDPPDLPTPNQRFFALPVRSTRFARRRNASAAGSSPGCPPLSMAVFHAAVTSAAGVPFSRNSRAALASKALREILRARARASMSRNRSSGKDTAVFMRPSITGVTSGVNAVERHGPRLLERCVANTASTSRCPRTAGSQTLSPSRPQCVDVPVSRNQKGRRGSVEKSRRLERKAPVGVCLVAGEHAHHDGAAGCSRTFANVHEQSSRCSAIGPVRPIVARGAGCIVGMDFSHLAGGEANKMKTLRRLAMLVLLGMASSLSGACGDEPGSSGGGGCGRVITSLCVSGSRPSASPSAVSTPTAPCARGESARSALPFVSWSDCRVTSIPRGGRLARAGALVNAARGRRIPRPSPRAPGRPSPGASPRAAGPARRPAPRRRRRCAARWGGAPRPRR